MATRELTFFRMLENATFRSTGKNAVINACIACGSFNSCNAFVIWGLGMKQERIEKLLAVLRDASGTWVTSAALSKRIGTTDRTVRNYITEINARGSARIESSRLGYRIVGRSDATATAAPTKLGKSIGIHDRMYFVLSRIINARGPVSVFDLADELAVSESTLASSTFPPLRRLLERFNLTLSSHDFMVAIDGTEENLRRLIGYAATHGSGAYFTSTQALKQMFPGYDIDHMLERFVDICQDSGLFLNNYALYNLLVHLVIILVRLQAGYSLESGSAPRAPELLLDSHHREAIARCADRIQTYCLEAFHVQPNHNDYLQVIALIALSSDYRVQDGLARERLVELFGQEFLDTIVNSLEALCTRYRLPEFDEEFILQFALHLHNACQRIAYNVSCPNPIAAQLKQDYAPVYDMSVFVMHQVSQAVGVVFSEDEIGFIAYHLGSYLESHKPGNQRTTCVLVIESYHDYANSFVSRLTEALRKEVEVLSTLGVDEYLKLLPTCDMVVTTIGFPHHHRHTVLVSPILSNRNIRKIRSEVEAIRRERRQAAALSYLQTYLTPELYLRNVHVSGAAECIKLLGLHCRDLGYVTEDFVEDVLLRERVSNTAFTDILAVPHAISKFALRSFVCVLHNDEPIPWGDRSVNFVLMIGLSPQDTHFFQDILDLIIELFLSPKRSMQALASDSYEQFMSMLTTGGGR